MKKIILSLAVLLVTATSVEARIFVNVLRGPHSGGDYAFTRENFNNINGQCQFNLYCWGNGETKCRFGVYDPWNTPGCTNTLINTTTPTSATPIDPNPYNTLLNLVDIQIGTATTGSGTIVTSALQVTYLSGPLENAVIIYNKSIIAATGEENIDINLYSYSEAHGLGLI